MHIRIGTRASRLALLQANIVASKLTCSFEIIPITTSGDRNISTPLYDIGGKALFIKELEEALLADKIDIAVHSLKDMPGILPEGFVIAAMLEREDARDALVSKIAKQILELPLGASVGTSSPRRMSYLKHLRPDLKLFPLRGNVDTRVEKVLSGEIDAAILSCAGLMRLGIDKEIYHPIDTSEIIPAIGQGVIAIETLEGNEGICEALNHKLTFSLSAAERSYLAHLDADCKTPAAAYARLENEKMITDFMLDIDGRIVTQSEISNIEEGYELGKKVALKMKSA